MTRGKVKFFSDEKGFGFIQPDDGSSDIFVHKSALESSGLHTLQKDQSVEYDVVKDHKNGKLKADRTKLVSP